MVWVIQRLSNLRSHSPVGVAQLWIVRPTTHMRHSITIPFLIVCSFLVGCRGPQVAFRDMDPKPTASVSGDTLTVHLGVITNIPVSEVWIGHKARIAGQTVSITGYQSFYHEQSREFAVRLPTSVSPQAVSVFWVDPDGSHVTVPIIRRPNTALEPTPTAP